MKTLFWNTFTADQVLFQIRIFTVLPLDNKSVQNLIIVSEVIFFSYSPNLEYDEDPEAEMYWMQYADFYDWPYIQHFDSYQHLKQLLLTIDFHEISNKIKKEVALKELKVTRTWCDVVKRVRN